MINGLTPIAAAVASSIPNTSPINTGLIGVMIALLTLVLRHQLANRKITVSENSGLRQEFISEMKELRTENAQLREQINKLHDEVFQLHGIISAMRQSNISAAGMLARNLSAEDPGIMRAIDALDNVKGTGE